MCGLVLNIFKMWQVDCQNIFSKTFQILICILEREQKWRDDWCHVAYTGMVWRWRGSRRRKKHGHGRWWRRAHSCWIWDPASAAPMQNLYSVRCCLLVRRCMAPRVPRVLVATLHFGPAAGVLNCRHYMALRALHVVMMCNVRICMPHGDMGFQLHKPHVHTA